MKTNTPSLILIPLLIAFALLQSVHAVVPPPDGGYPGFNTAEGQNALLSLTTGVGNTAVGWFSLKSNVDGSFNTAIGAGTLLLNIGDQSTEAGIQNTAVGAAALLFNTTGSLNTACGSLALSSNTQGVSNNAFGWRALQSNTTGSSNTANGVAALNRNTTGSANTADGWNALLLNTTGNDNTATGLNALIDNISGSDNTAVGINAGINLETGSGNVYIGSTVSAGGSAEGATTRIRNIGSTAIVGGVAVVVDGTGGIGDQRLGYASSSRRYKQEIEEMCDASETLFALKPVSFRAKADMDPAHVRHYGLIAEDVAMVDPDLVVYNPEGKPETLRFDSINAMLLNEFLKEHKTVQEQGATIAQQQKEIQTLIATVREQSAQIQKVSAQVQLNAAPAIAANP